MMYLLLTLFFIIFQAFFSGFETGIISVLKPRLIRGVMKGQRGAKQLLFFIERPGIMLATTLTGTNIGVVCSSNMAKKSAISFGFDSEAAFLALGCVMSIVLAVAEIIPKDWFRQSPYQRCRRCAGIFTFTFYALYLPAYLLSAYVGWINRLCGTGEKDVDAALIMRKDFSLLLKESGKAGLIDLNTADMIDRALYFHSKKVKDFMLAREKVVEVAADLPLIRAHEISKRFDIARMPVAENNDNGTDNWIGIFSVYDLVFDIEESAWESMKVRDVMRALAEIPSDEKISTVYEKARTGASPLLVVRDPGGAHCGIVSVFDLSERLFGF